MPILKAVVAMTTRSFPATCLKEERTFSFISAFDAFVYMSITETHGGLDILGGL